MHHRHGLFVIRFTPSGINGPKQRNHGNVKRVTDVPRSTVRGHQELAATDHGFRYPKTLILLRHAQHSGMVDATNNLSGRIPFTGATQHENLSFSAFIDKSLRQVNIVVHWPVLG